MAREGLRDSRMYKKYWDGRDRREGSMLTSHVTNSGSIPNNTFDHLSTARSTP